MKLSDLIEKARKADCKNEREQRMINIPIYLLCDFDTPEDALRAIKHSLHTTRSNFQKI